MLTDCHKNPSIIPSTVGCCMCLALLPAASTALELLGLSKHEKELRDHRKDISFREAIPFTSHGRWEQNFPSFAAYSALTAASSREAKRVPQRRWAAACQEPACQPEMKPGWAGQAQPNWECSHKHAVRNWEHKDTAGISGRSARPLVGEQRK